jgi:riboflavin biosynthesis pyrimidine reductase
MNKLVLLVEGGTQLLESFLAAGLWDEIQVEQSPVYLRKGVPAPCLIGLNGLLMTEKVVGEGDQHRIIRSFRSESSLQLTGLFPQLRGSARI